METIEKREIKFTTHFRKSEKKLLEKLRKELGLSRTEVIVKALYELNKGIDNEATKKPL